MAYDEALADRLRELLAAEQDVSEKRMFGGLAFLLGGRMAVAASRQGGLLLRCDPRRCEQLLARDHVEPMVMRGRETGGWLHVHPQAVGTDVELRDWVAEGVAAVRALAAHR